MADPLLDMVEIDTEDHLRDMDVPLLLPQGNE